MSAIARRPVPWRDRDGTLSASRIAVLLLLAAPAAWLSITWIVWGLGPRPLTAAIHETGLWTIRFLLASLMVTPLRQILRAPRLMAFRRMIGVSSALYAVAHLSLYLIDLKFDMAKLVSEIALRAYLTIGFFALAILIALATTSTDAMVRRLGRAWQRLHRLAYAAMALGVVHFLMHSKTDVMEAALMGGAFAWAMVYRAVAPRGAAPSPAALLLLAPVAGLLTALGEAGWIGLFTGLSGWMMLAANLDPYVELFPELIVELRPALWVVLVALAAPALRWWFSARRSASPRRTASMAPPAEAAP